MSMLCLISFFNYFTIITSILLKTCCPLIKSGYYKKNTHDEAHHMIKDIAQSIDGTISQKKTLPGLTGSTGGPLCSFHQSAKQ